MRVKAHTWREVKASFLPNECTAFAPDGDIQAAINQRVIELARLAKLPLLMTLDAHFVHPDRKFVQDILLQNGNPNGWRFDTVYSQLDTAQCWELWGRDGYVDAEREKIFQEAVENNAALASRIEPITLERNLQLPPVELPDEIRVTSHTEDYKFLLMTMQRIRHHGKVDLSRPEYVDRLEREIGVIKDNGTLNFLPYFLFLDDLCENARDMGMLVGPGRGSAAGCLLAYALNITQIDPIEYGLSFARFLSQGRINRGKFPDIDLDFGDPAAVAAWLEARFGDQVCRISTTGTMRLKGAIKDVARVLLDTKSDPVMMERIEAMSKTIGFIPQGMNTFDWLDGHESDGTWVPGELETNTTLREFFSEFPQVERGVRGVLDVPRSIGRHASAYCVAQVPVSEVVPMCVVKDERCTQFTMDPVEALGLIKIDLLGLNTLNDINGCIKLVEERHRKKIDVYNIPLKNRAAWAAFRAGRNATVFQFNSDIGVDLCQRIAPTCLLDLAQLTAAGRPGTMDSLMPDGETKLIDAWIEVRNGLREAEYVHPSVAEILAPTGGVTIFQEQISAMFQVACGFSEERADEVREIVGKKKHDQMQALLPEIREALHANGWNMVQTESFISLCIAAANYSFNKSHAVAYAYLGYVCQYLKENYQIEWWTSVLQNSSADDMKKNAKHCANLVQSPDINLSNLDFFIIDDEQTRAAAGVEVHVQGGGTNERIIYPLRMVKQVKSAAEDIVSKRPFKDLADFYERVERRKCNLGVVKSLIWAGAFDAMCGVTRVEDRNHVYEQYMILRGQRVDDKPDYVRLTELEIMHNQMIAMPLGTPDYVEMLCRRTGFQIFSPDVATGYPENTDVTVGGIILRMKRHLTKRGDAMCFLDIANGDEECSLTVFPDEYARVRDFLAEEVVIYAQGAVNVWKGRRGIKVDRLHVYSE